MEHNGIIQPQRVGLAAAEAMPQPYHDAPSKARVSLLCRCKRRLEGLSMGVGAYAPTGDDKNFTLQPVSQVWSIVTS